MSTLRATAEAAAAEETAAQTPIEIAEGVWRLELPIGSPLESVNVYLLDDGDGWTLVDTGEDCERAHRRLLEVLRQPPFAHQPLQRVLVTHFHPDHIGLAGRIVKENVRLLCSAECFYTAQRLWESKANLPCEQRVDFMRRAGMKGLELDAFQRSRPANFSDRVSRPPQDFETLVDLQKLELGQRQWTVLLCEGHAKGHATLWSDGNLALVGDQVLPAVAPNLSIHYSCPDDAPIAGWLNSCAKLENHAAEDTLALPGHGQPFVGIPRRCQQLADNSRAVIERLLEYLKRPATALECLSVVYRRPLADYERSLLIAEVMGYLNHLRNNRLVVRRLSKNGSFLWKRA